MKESESIIKGSTQIKYSKKTRYTHFIAEDYPALCIEPEGQHEESRQLRQTTKDEYFELALYYLEKADVNRDMTQFIIKVENLIDTLRQSGNLNRSVLSFEIGVKYLDRSQSDNIEHIGQITIKGRLK